MNGRALPILTALALAGCGGGGGGSAPGDPDRPGSPAEQGARPDGTATQLERLLARRAAALEKGDAGAYAATATGRQRTRDRRAARNARPLRLRDVELVVRAADVRGASARLRVASLYGIRGIAGRFQSTRRVSAARTKVGWRVRSETSRRERHPWELGRFTRSRSRHFVVLAPSDIDVEAGGLLEDLETGYERLGEAFSQPKLRPRYLVLVAAGSGDARSLTQSISGVGNLAAISDTEVRERGAARQVASVASQRLVVVWSAFSSLDGEARTRVVTHELTHAALAPATSGRTPAWLLEGTALYVSGDDRVEMARALLDEISLARLARPDAIARLSGPAQEAAYAYSSAAAFYLAERFGQSGLLDLYDVFNDEELEGDAGAALTRRAVRKALGVSLGRLEEDLRDWIAGG